jgi:hypothetical protein
VAKVFKKALKATVALKAVAVSEKAETIVNISYYLHIKRSIISVIS